MSDDRKKLYSKKPTGTVPKIKYRNNTSQVNQDGANHNVSSNNLVHYDDGRDCYQSKLKFYGNSELLKRNFLQPFSVPMDNTIEEQRSTPKQNANGMASTPSTSTSASRRNSTGTAPKSDNVTKYPDKKHIEDRLTKIREYLNATSSLITNMKNTDDQSTDEAEKESLMQMFNDLKDSEAKLLAMLSVIEKDEAEVEKVSENGLESLDKAELERRCEQATREVQALQEQENMLLNLQLAAENQLRDARQAQHKLALQANKGNNNQERNTNTATDQALNAHLTGFLEMMEHQNAINKNSNETYFDPVRDLEERFRNMADPRSRSSSANPTDNVQAQIEALQQNLGMLRDSNDNRNHLIQILDNRDAQLRSEHLELQGRLLELQSKKNQVDHLVSQLQSMNEESEDEDVGAQVRRIVNMKDQLAKLKDMLDAVKSTETMLETQNVNESDADVQEAAHALPTKSDNLRRSANRSLSESNASARVDNQMLGGRLDNQAFRSPNVRKVAEKQVNKSSIKANEREKLKLQEELQAKKRELEELMYKHKAVSSNLNQDVHNENKTDHFNIQFDSDVDSWRPVPNFNLPSSDSDECPEEDVNEYSEFDSSGDTNNTSLLQPMPSLNYPTSNYVKRRDAEAHSSRATQSPHVSKTPDRSVRGSSIATPVHRHRERPTTNTEQDAQNKTQVRNKFEMIQRVYDSIMSENNNQEVNVQQLRNNLTPSPLYSEPRQFGTPNSQFRNALSTVNAVAEPAWMPPTVPPYPAPDMTNYQNFLATNTLQTQAFMLNTLNQCCQMMWLQQRELASLRSTVSLMLERFPMDQSAASQSFMNANAVYNPGANAPDARPHPQIRPSNNSKSNQVSSATSLPNLSHVQVSHTNMEPACANNLQSAARVVESNLNNTIVHNHQNEIGDHANNMHNMNQPLPSQIWNGQALNNQVAPGNRANNYWDNFRSYSRQNLLSTKSNDGLQNMSSEGRSHNALERSNSYTLPSATVPKRNTEHHDSGNASIENTPRRRACFRTIRASSGETIDIVHNIPPDVLNVNQTQKSNENHDLFELPIGIISEENLSSGGEASASHQPSANVCRPNSALAANMKLCQEQSRKDLQKCRQNRYKKLWQNSQDGLPRSLHSLYTQELRENIFKGVAKLIAANEDRPHFLIQLLKGLHKVRSDHMRCRTLQSLQTLVANAEEPADLRQDQEAESFYADYQEVLSRLWPRSSSKNCGNLDNESTTNHSVDIDYMLSEVLLFLNANGDKLFQLDFLDAIKDLLVQSRMSSIPKDEIVQRYFISLLECSVGAYRGKLIKDVKIYILKAIEDILRMDMMKFIIETSESSDEDENITVNNVASVNHDLPAQNAVAEDVNPPQMQNGDLAEADQSRLVLEDEEEEGAVGGVLNLFVERGSNHNQVAPDEAEMAKMEFSNDAEADAEFVEQGLDQVPTRLSSKSRTRSTTPSKDRSSSRTDAAEQF